MAESSLTRDQLASEAMSILKALRENVRLGKSNKLADVKSNFELKVSIEFDTYFFFLRKYHFIGLDREACLQLTSVGEKIIDGERRDRFSESVQEYFASRIASRPAAEGAPLLLLEEAISDPVVPAEDLARRSTPVDVEVAPAPALPIPLTPAPRHDPRPDARAERAEDKPRVPKPSPSYPLRSDKEADMAAPPPSPKPSKTDTDARVSSDGKGQEVDLRYVKYDAMGQGPLGTVYRGRHTALGLDVCVKELKDIFGYFSFLQRGEVIKRLKRELCAQALVRHPNVVAVLDQNCDVARPYFVLELCSGGSLRQQLDQAGGKGLPVERAVRIFLQIAYGLRTAHAQGLTHGNLKPENVLLDHYGNSKLGDFGLARVIEVDPARGMPQVFVGTGGMGYMSPEQLARSTKDVGPASDVYALGMLLYEMLTGGLPGRRSPLPSGVNAEAPAKLDPLFDKMTQDKREQRYPDIEAVLADFYAAFEDGKYLKKGDLILSSDGIPSPPAPKAEPKAEA
jgi:hypothetical protein